MAYKQQSSTKQDLNRARYGAIGFHAVMAFWPSSISVSVFAVASCGYFRPFQSLVDLR